MENILPYLGGQLQVHILLQPLFKKIFITRRGEALFIETPDCGDERLRQALRDWYIREARREIGAAVSRYAQIMDISYGRIAIRGQHTRWGSCSSNANLNFNWRLVMMPQAVLEYVVVHELAHRRQMNHSPLFWAEVEKVLPNYREADRWLKKNGKYFLHVLA